MKTVIYTKGIVNGKNVFQLLAEAGTEIMLFLLPSDPSINNANVDPNGTIFNIDLSDEEFERHMKLNPQLEWVAL